METAHVARTSRSRTPPVPETFTDNGEDKRSLRRPVVGRVVYIHPKGHYHTVEFELNGGHVRESFKGVSD